MKGDCVNCVVVGVGGQGIILVSRIIGEAAMNSEMNVMVSEIHGMAQRGGKVVGSIRIGRAHSPMIRSGQADIVLGLEPVETYRHLDMLSKKTTVVADTVPVYPFTVTSGEERYPDMDLLFAQLEQACGQVLRLNTQEIASDAGLPAIVRNIIILGAMLGACGDFPVSRSEMEESVKENVPERFLDANLKAFERGYEEAKKSM